MNCYVCGSSVHEGDTVCPECGARLSKGSNQPAALTPEWFAASEKQKEGHRNFLYRASYPISNLFTCKIVSLICVAVTLGMVVILLIAAMDGIRTESLYGLYEYTYYTESFESLYTTLIALLWIPAIAVLVVGIVYMVNLGKLGDFDSDFSTALGLGLAKIVISLIDSLVKDGTISFILSVATFIISIVYYYYLCNGFSCLCREEFPELSNRWSLLFKLFVTVVIASTVSGIVVALKAANDGVTTGLVVWMVIVYVISLVQEILELVALKKTANAFGSFWNAK